MIGNKKIKVLQVVPILAYGGVEKIVVNYYNNLNHDEYEFDFISHGKSSPYAEQLRVDGCKIFEVETIGSLGSDGYKKQIAQTVDVSDYDVVHIHLGHITGVYAKIFRKLGAKKIICHAHTTKCVNTKHALLMPMFRWLANHYSDHRLSCGEKAGDFCFGKQKYQLLQNGIDYGRFQAVSGDEIDSVKRELGLQATPLIIGHIGHFSTPKNHPYIVRMIEKYHSINPEAKFVLVGDGPDKPMIENLIREKALNDFVIFTGVRQDIPIVLKTFDLFILPSLHEGLPVVSIEAQAAGTECLLSDRIDTSLDIGLDLVRFLPLDDDCDEWIKMIENTRVKGKKSVDGESIHTALLKCGYDIAASAENLGKIYRLVIGDEKNSK